MVVVVTASIVMTQPTRPCTLSRGFPGSCVGRCGVVVSLVQCCACLICILVQLMLMLVCVRVCAAGETPMTCAAYYGHTDVIKELIENGADVNLVS